MSLLNYTECEFDAGQIEKARDEFQALHAKIAGRSEGYESITSRAGGEFSDLIGDGLKRLATDNQAAWGSALLACLHGYGVLDKTLTDTNWYNDEIDRIKARLTNALNAIPISDQDNHSTVRGTRLPFDNEARSLWTRFEERCDETEEILKDGPTPRRIRELAEGGYFGLNEQAGYESTGNLDFYVIEGDYNVDLITVHLFEAVVNGRDGSIQMLESDPRTLKLMGNMFRRAEQAREAGETLSDRELAYLEEIYQILGHDGKGQEPGFLWFAEQVQNSDHVSEDLRRDIQRSLANGMLVLSDEQVGGGMSRLPEDVQRAAVGPDRIEPSREGEDPGVDLMSHSSWSGEWIKLGDFLQHSGSGVHGGTEFSTSMLRTSSDMLLRATVDEYPSVESFQNVIDVATRNQEANHVILTGEGFGGEKYPEHDNHRHLSPKETVQNLYSIPWPDEGEAVRGLTDWMAFESSPEDQGIPENAREQSLVALMEMMEDDEFKEAVMHTGATAKGEDDEGNQVEWRDASTGQLNPRLAEGLSDVLVAHMEAFARTDGLSSGGTTTELDGDIVRLSPQSRLAFTELIVADPAAAGRLYAQIELNTGRAMDGFTEDTGNSGHLGATRAGVLLGLVEQALVNEADSRLDSHNDSVTRRNTMSDAATDVASSMLLDVGVPNTIATIANLGADNVWEVPTRDGADTNAQVRGEWVEREQMQLMAIHALVEEHPELMDTIEEEYPGIVRGTGDDRYLPASFEDWGESDRSDGEDSSAVKGVFGLINGSDWPSGSGLSGREAVADFIENFNDHRAKWKDVG